MVAIASGMVGLRNAPFLREIPVKVGETSRAVKSGQIWPQTALENLATSCLHRYLVVTGPCTGLRDNGAHLPWPSQTYICLN